MQLTNTDIITALFNSILMLSRTDNLDYFIRTIPTAHKIIKLA